MMKEYNMKDQIRILIVEDEALTGMALKMHFQDNGFYVCKVAPDYDSAINQFNNESPNILLMDIRLSKGFDGIETAKAIRNKDPHIPIIFMTGYEDDEIKDRAMVVDPIGFFIKPLNIEEIVNMIKTKFLLE